MMNYRAAVILRGLLDSIRNNRKIQLTKEEIEILSFEADGPIQEKAAEDWRADWSANGPGR